MSELRDYQRVFVDNIIEDIWDCFRDLEDGSSSTLRDRFESRITTYDRERKEQIERDLPSAIVRAMADVC